MRRIPLNEKGVTLIELLISSVILIVVIAAFNQLVQSFYQNYLTQEEIAEMQQQGRVVGDLLSREVQMAGYDPKGLLFLPDRPNENRRTKEMSKVVCERSAHPAEQVLEATPIIFHFLADLNGNTVINDSISSQKDIDEDVRYEWVGASGVDSCGTRKSPFTLYRDSGGGGGAQEVGIQIDQFRLVYFDEEDRPFPERALTHDERGRIRKILMTLRARSDRRDPRFPLDDGHRTRQVAIEVRLRNM
ncbi:MAG: hypothetical protein EPO39_11555 [Candidatus Manganitrophaceae bacterium]|nr:MAG: hypothetical protein EPO39_11555 [Candidatus Manganitrophaceae bacterium]